MSPSQRDMASMMVGVGGDRRTNRGMGQSAVGFSADRNFDSTTRTPSASAQECSAPGPLSAVCVGLLRRRWTHDGMR